MQDLTPSFFVLIAGVHLFCVPIPDGFIYTPQEPP